MSDFNSSSCCSSSGQAQKVEKTKGISLPGYFLIALVILLLFFVIESTHVWGLESACPNQVEPNGFSCSVISEHINCSVYNYSVYDSDNVLSQSGNLTSLIDDFYYFDFNSSESDFFVVEYCDNSSSILTVGYDNGKVNLYLYALLLVLVALFLIIGFLVKNNFFMAVAGMVSIIVGVGMSTYTFAGFTKQSTELFSIVFVSLGIFFFIVSAMRYINEFWGDE